MTESLTAVWLLPMEDGTVFDALETDVAEHPKWPDVLNRYGLALLANSRPLEARSVFEKSLASNPRYAWAGLNLAATLAVEGNFDEAFNAVGRGQDPVLGAQAVTEAWIAILAGRPDRGESAFRRVHPRDHDRADILWARAALGELRGASQGAEAWKKVLAEPVVASWFREVDALRKPLRGRGLRGGLFPGLHQLWMEASRIQGHQHRFVQAQRSLRVAYMYWSDRGAFLRQQGLLASLEGKRDLAVEFYEEAMDVAPTDPAPATALADHYAEHGEIDSSARYLREALERAPGYADLHRRLGLLERSRGHYDEAVVAFRRALEINPLYAIARLDLARTHFLRRRWSEAAEAFRGALNAGIESADLLLHLGKCHEQQGDGESAEKAYRRALEINPEEALAHYRLGKLYKTLGRIEDAKSAWLAFLDLTQDPDAEREVTELLQDR